MRRDAPSAYDGATCSAMFGTVSVSRLMNYGVCIYTSAPGTNPVSLPIPVDKRPDCD